MTVTFACGHHQQVDGKAEPICVCGNRRVVAVKAPRPTFHGTANGPCAQFEDLPGKPAPWSRHA